MGNSRTRNTLLILFSSGVRQIITLVTTFIIRTVFIHTLGAEYLGLNGLFTNILSLLALSELGIGTAITFYLYKPIQSNDIDRIKTLMAFYKLCYRAVGLTIIGVGLFLMPVLPYIVNLETPLNINLYLIYFLYLINTASSYLLFAYKQSFLLANQQQYKVERVSTSFCLLQFLFDFITVAVFKNFYLYLIGDIIAVLFKNYMISKIANRDFPFLKEKESFKITRQELKKFFKDIFSVSLFKVGSQLFNATDNIIISLLLGTIIVGYYSNYYLLISYATLFFGMIMKSFTAGIGNVMASECEEKRYIIFKRIDFIMFVVATIASVCMCQLFNSFMLIWVGNKNKNFILSQAIVFILSFDFYINCSCQTPNTFREASGNFESGKWLQLFGGIINILLSLLLGHYYKLTGIFAATIISKIFVTVVPFLWKISKSVFNNKPYDILLEYFKKLMLRTVITVVVWNICKSVHMTGILGLLWEGLICIGVTTVLICAFYFNTDEFNYLKTKIKHIKNA